MEDDRPTSTTIDEEENEEDALPDWRQFAKFVKSQSSEYSISLGGGPTPTIPKRGEKDFEPVPSSSSSTSFQQSSRDATLSAHQISTLQDSRSALFTAISSGSRHHSSKGYNSFTWRPNLDGGRATCDNNSLVFGIQFASLGHYHIGRKRLELRPEEALYMLEKGGLELWRELKEGAEGVESDSEGMLEEKREGMIPMTVQQGWTEILGHDELTLERFEVYTYLKRMGYVVIRARIPPPISTEIRPLPFYKRSILSLLQPPFISFHHFTNRIFSMFGSILMPTKIRLKITRLLKVGEGSLSALASGRRWTLYEQIYKRLQIIPTGHDTPLPRQSLPQTPSVLNTIISSNSATATPELRDLQTDPYQVFFHLYKPVTKFKKSAPPEPDYRLVIINTTTTPLPTVFDADYLFSSQPLLPPPKPRAPYVRPIVTPSLPAAPSRFAPRVAKPPLPPPPHTFLQSFCSYIPFLPLSYSTPVSPSSTNKKFIPPKKGTPGYRKHPKALYGELKRGVKNVLVAVVENGTISTLLITQSEFGKHVWMGDERSS